MLGKFEHEVLHEMPRDEFARWCAFLEWEEHSGKSEAVRLKQLAKARE